MLDLTASISNLQSQQSTLKGQYGSLQALVGQTTLPGPLTPTLNPNATKLQKPPPRQFDEPKITEFQGLTYLEMVRQMFQWHLEPYSHYFLACCRY